MTIIPVALGDRSYPVRIEAGLLARAGEILKPLARGRPMAIVADANVSLHLARLQESLTEAGVASEAIVLPPGEGSKSWATLEHLTDRLLDLGIERNDHVVALGGGVIGDLVGFATAILKRGCGFVQIPTTLLAQVDSSVGGKTAINARAGKNLIGAFHQPALVLIDPQVLDTLPPRDVRAGYAEVVKYGLIDDFAFFEWCEANGTKLLAGDAHAQHVGCGNGRRRQAHMLGVAEPDEEAVPQTAPLEIAARLGRGGGHAVVARAADAHERAALFVDVVHIDFEVPRRIGHGQEIGVRRRGRIPPRGSQIGVHLALDVCRGRHGQSLRGQIVQRQDGSGVRPHVRAWIG